MIRTVTAVLAEARATLPPPVSPPPPQRIRTLSDLRSYAADHGITLTIPAKADNPHQPH